MATTKKKATKTRKKHIEKRDIRKKFWFVLEEKEKVDYGCTAADLETEIQREEAKVADLKEKIKAHNSLITECAKERRRLLNCVKTGKEMREVDAIEVKDFEAKTVRYMMGRKVIEEREMTGDETQRSMNLEQSKKRKTEAKETEKKATAEKKLRKEAEEFKAKKNETKTTEKTTTTTANGKAPLTAVQGGSPLSSAQVL